MTRRDIIRQAWPIMLSQTLVPLVGLIDVVVIGRTGDAPSLAGVALGANLINLVFWTFGFLRMGVTGLTAQAFGGGDRNELDGILWRAMLVGLGVGSVLTALSPFCLPTALALFHVPPSAALPASQFTAARLLGAPAALGFYVINGWLLGLGRTRTALVCQAIFNAANIALDVLFVVVFDMHALGVGLGTTIAEWLSLAVGLVAVRKIRGPEWLTSVRRTTFRFASFRRMATVNANIMARTIALLLVFAWFARAGARLGTTTLAANYVLLQLVTVSAYVLDGFALTAEIQVGIAIGAGSRPVLRRAIRLTAECSLIGGAAFTALFLFGGQAIVAAIAASSDVRAVAFEMLPFCALIPLVGAPAWLLDGVFIGATRGKALRNATIAALILYLLTDFLLRPRADIGAWLALLSSYLYRAGALAAHLPGLFRSVPPDRADRKSDSSRLTMNDRGSGHRFQPVDRVERI